MSTMNALVKVRPEVGGLEMLPKPVPALGPHDVMVKPRAMAICGTDLHIYNWDPWSQGRLKLPRIIGHEFSGEVVDVGRNVKHIKPGDYVSGEGHLFCGRCDRCKQGDGHVCYDWKGVGYDVDGCFADYFALPSRNVWLNDPDLDPAWGAIQDPLGNAVHAVFQTDCVNKKVAVYGCGPVGLLIVSVLKAIGAAEIFAVEWDNDYRMNLARKVGADYVIKGKDVDPVEFIRAATDGRGVDVAIEVAGAPKALTDALASVRLAGHLVLLGLPNGKVALDISEGVVFRSLHIHGVTGRKIWDTWYRMKGLFRSGNLKVDDIITHKLPFADFQQGFDLMREGRCGKVVLYA